jgi:hypothetical protein
MCHVYGATIDGDRFFLKKGIAERESKNYFGGKEKTRNV